MIPPRLVTSHHVQRWHEVLVERRDGGLTLLHRMTGERREVAAPFWAALERVLAWPHTREECLDALERLGFERAVVAAEVDALARARFLVDPEADFWDSYAPDLVAPADAELGRARLRWARDAIDPHGEWMYSRWLGARALQLPQDLWWMQQLIVDTRPAVLVETGLFEGGSALFYASVFELLGEGEVIAIERNLRPDVRSAIEASPLSRRITLLEGDSASDAIVADVATRLGERVPVIVALDSDHSTSHVLAELEQYAPLVDARGKVVVFDTSMSLVPRHGASNPHLAVKAFLNRHRDWRVATMPGGAFATACEDGLLERRPRAERV